jgi:hypothetical protein
MFSGRKGKVKTRSLCDVELVRVVVMKREVGLRLVAVDVMLSLCVLL